MSFRSVSARNHLVVVHPNMLAPNEFLRDNNLANKIRRRTLATLNHTAVLMPRRVYIATMTRIQPLEKMRHFADLISRSTIIPDFQDTPDLQFPVGFTLVDPQFLLLKRRLLEDGTSRVDLAGVARSRCVESIRLLLEGKPRRNMGPLAECLRMSVGEIHEIVFTRVSAEVQEDLCED